MRHLIYCGELMWKSPDSQWTTVSLIFELPWGIKLIFSSYQLQMVNYINLY